ncbi:MAG: hypothetical protein ACHQHN_14015 [Sphingobacteriales bacterium]
MGKISFENLKMNVVQTAPNGVVNQLTIFTFSQNGSFVSATYTGGPIFRGYLVGAIHHNRLSFSYCQVQADGKIDNGQSECEIRTGENGKIQLVENFKWASRDDESGVNIFQEL